MKQFLLLEKAKDEVIIFKVPGAMKEKLLMDSKRFGIDTSKLLRYILAVFLTMQPTEQVTFIKSMGSKPESDDQEEPNKKSSKKKKKKSSKKKSYQSPESDDRERE